MYIPLKNKSADKQEMCPQDADATNFPPLYLPIYLYTFMAMQ